MLPGGTSRQAPRGSDANPSPLSQPDSRRPAAGASPLEADSVRKLRCSGFKPIGLDVVWRPGADPDVNTTTIPRDHRPVVVPRAATQTLVFWPQIWALTSIPGYKMLVSETES